MAYIDVFFIGVTLFSVGMGFYRGFVWETLKYLALLIAAAISIFILMQVFHFFEQSEYVFVWLLLLGGLSFLSFSSLFLYFVYRLSSGLHLTPFAITDRIAGAVFGGLRAVLFIVLLHLVLMIITINKKPDWLASSMFVGPLDRASFTMQDKLKGLGSQKLNKLLKLDALQKPVESLSKYI